MTTQEIQTKIAEEAKQALIEVWCNVHGINSYLVKYEDGKLIIPVSF